MRDLGTPWLRRLRRMPPAWRVMIGLGLVTAAALAINGVYQVARKPTELSFPVSGVLAKTPAETWREYGPAFRRYATPAIDPELLAALAQVEGSGNPLVRTYWRWSWAPRPFDLYRPASSAVGMYQITDSTFAEAGHYCIHRHALVREGPWNDWHSCCAGRVPPRPTGNGASASPTESVAVLTTRASICGASMRCMACSRSWRTPRGTAPPPSLSDGGRRPRARDRARALPQWPGAPRPPRPRS